MTKTRLFLLIYILFGGARSVQETSCHNSITNKYASSYCNDFQVRFILAVVEDRMQVNNRKKSELLEQLKSEGYDLFLPA